MFGSAGNETQCIQVANNVFSCLDELDKFVFISADEIYVKPAIWWHSGQILGYAKKTRFIDTCKDWC